MSTLILGALPKSFGISRTLVLEIGISDKPELGESIEGYKMLAAVAMPWFGAETVEA